MSDESMAHRSQITAFTASLVSCCFASFKCFKKKVTAEQGRLSRIADLLWLTPKWSCPATLMEQGRMLPHLLTHFIFLAALPLYTGGLRSPEVLASPFLWHRVGGALLSVLKCAKQWHLRTASPLNHAVPSRDVQDCSQLDGNN